MAAASPVILCLEKQRLVKEFERAVSELHSMQSAQLLARRNGADFPFQEQIAAASERRECVKHAIIAHQQDQGC
jgi:hypothetical protein